MSRSALTKMQVTVPRRPMIRRWVALTAAVVVLVGFSAWYVVRGASLPEGVSPADYGAAVRRFGDLYGRPPSRIEVFSLLGELAVGDGRLATAVACFREIPSKTPRYGLSARLQEGQVLVRLNQAREAEQNFREFLALSQGNPSVREDHVVVARNWLDYILSVELRFEERKLLLAEVHACGQADVFDSKQYYFPNLLIWHSSAGRHRLMEFLKEAPEDPQLRLAHGRYLTAEGKLDEAQALLENLCREHPGDLRCTAALLECHYERNDWKRLAEVAKTLPDDERVEPWLLTRMRGELALHQGNWKAAAAHFESVLEVDPANPGSHMGLARSYAELQRPEDSEEIRRRSLILAKIRVSLVNVKENDDEPALELAAACAEIGLREAAETFRQHALRIKRVNQRARSSRAMPQ